MSGVPSPLPKRPYRDSAAQPRPASLIVLSRGRRGEPRARVVFATLYFVIATAWAWWRFKQRHEKENRERLSLDAAVEALAGDLSRIRAPRGTQLNARSWQTEAPLRMLLNNLDPEVAERPEELVVYGGSGRAARSHDALKAIVRTLLRLRDDETLLVQSGKPVGVFRTHEGAPRVLIANSLLVPKWATWDEFRRLEAEGLTMFGQMTAGSWIYIGTQGILQGTYQTFAAAGEKHFGSAT